MQEKSPLNSSSLCPEARDTITPTLTCLPSVQSKVNSSETSTRQMMCESLLFVDTHQQLPAVLHCEDDISNQGELVKTVWVFVFFKK